jgi:hypothetical protein
MIIDSQLNPIVWRNFMFGWPCISNYRVIKKCLCTWWLQYRKLQLMFKVSPASLQTFIDTRLTLTPSFIHNSNYVITVSDLNCLKYFCVFFLSGNHQVHRDFLITRYIRIMNQHDALFFTLFPYHASTCFGLILARHQDAKCIMWQWYLFYLLGDCLRARRQWNISPVQT